MFFSDRIASIKPVDKVLEIGPGATPYFRSDVFLEKEYASDSERIAQSGHVGLLKTDKPIFFYDGSKFPFQDKEFDYIICSHVLEHVHDADDFLKEVQRVGKMGYLEFPTIYYDYLYNFPEHKLLLLHAHGVINWMTKEEIKLDAFKRVQEFFYETCVQEYYDLIDSLRPYLFQGFEWKDKIESKKVTNLAEVTYNVSQLHIPKRQKTGVLDVGAIPIKDFLKGKVKKFLNR